MLLISGVSFVIWIWLLLFHGRFWSKGPILYPLSEMQKNGRESWPEVHVIVPARNEAETIETVISSLLNQDYEGKYDITLVDDESDDGTGTLIKRLCSTLPEEKQKKIRVIEASHRPEGWSGKLWALSQGIERVNAEKSAEDSFFLFTDADIYHEPSHLTALVNKAMEDDLAQVSEMVQLRCNSLSEKALIPAFVFFFCMLYPFAKVNDPASSVAAGAGGTVLIRKKALRQIGGIAALKNALIDDVTLAFLVKKACGKIYLGHSSLATSLRPYDSVEAIWRMIIRSAYVQLRYSISWLLGTVLLMGLVWFAPFLTAVFAKGIIRDIAFLTYMISILSFIPTLSRFRISFFWIFALPFIALFYLVATIASALNYYRGAGMVWKGRAYTKISMITHEDQVDPSLGHLFPVNGDHQDIKHKG